MSAAKAEARRLARHRAEMELALGEGISLAAAKARLAAEHCRRTTRCGTRADSAPELALEPAPRPRSWMDGYDNY